MHFLKLASPFSKTAYHSVRLLYISGGCACVSKSTPPDGTSRQEPMEISAMPDVCPNIQVSPGVKRSLDEADKSLCENPKPKKRPIWFNYKSATTIATKQDEVHRRKKNKNEQSVTLSKRDSLEQDMYLYKKHRTDHGLASEMMDYEQLVSLCQSQMHKESISYSHKRKSEQDVTLKKQCTSREYTV